MSQNILRISYDAHDKQRLFFLYIIYHLVLVMGMMQYKDASMLKKLLCVERTLKIETASSSKTYSSITNKKQRYTMVFITINALHVSGGSSAHHQELKTVYTASGICQGFSASAELESHSR
jgi:hypothetical protein